MKKKAFIIAAVLVVAAAGAAEYRFFIADRTKPETLQISVSEENVQEGINHRDNAIIVSQAEKLKYYYNGVSSSEKDEQKAASELLAVIEKIEKMSHGTVTKNTGIEKKSGETEYCKVTDRSFGSVSDLKSYLSTSVTTSLLNSRYNGMTEGDAPVYADFEDGLYVRRKNDSAEDFEFKRDDKKNIILAVTGRSEGIFTVSASGHTFEIVEDDGKWKINSVS